MTYMDMMRDNAADMENEFAELSDNEVAGVAGGIIPIVIGVVWAVTQIGLAVAQREVCSS